MLNGATCAPGRDGGAVLGGWGPELDAIVAPMILPCLGPVGGLGVDHEWSRHRRERVQEG
jgi:hypothetical protein